MAATATLQHVRFDPDRLRAARQAAGMSLRAVGARTGQSFTTIHRYESGLIDPPTSVLAVLATVYGVHPGDLFGPRT